MNEKITGSLQAPLFVFCGENVFLIITKYLLTFVVRIYNIIKT